MHLPTSQSTKMYDMRQRVCLNGHQLPARDRFCAECGEPGITACPACRAIVRGGLCVKTGNKRSFLPDDTIPSYCHSCGKPLPWTERRIAVGLALLDEDDRTTEADKMELRAAFKAISVDSPETALGVARILKIVKRVGKSIGDAIYKIAIDVGSEAAKKALLGP